MKNDIRTNHSAGKIIVINGPSSSGKSTLTKELQRQFEIPFLRYSFDLFLDSQALPMEQIRNGKISWKSMRPNLFSGLQQCLPILANAGNNIVFDHIIETKEMLHELLHLTADMDIYFVGLHCSLEELERREIARGNRGSGDARKDFETVHRITTYDLELDSENNLVENAKTLITAWEKRARPSALDRMLKELA